ncbi:MAG: hypothetical protein M3Y13_13450 [Armatimonadota bacterium]|nr:hypothetical protein [Armatimonadota bacterium]
MPRFLTNLVKTLALSLFLGLAASSVSHAQATRTWVSGVGDDANPCSRTAPCKTFAGAISKTAAGGEIDALDPGGFGGLTITKSITIDGGGGQVASVLVSGTPGITINAGSTDIVCLRNLSISGTGMATTGINLIASGQLIVEHCKIFGFAQAATIYASTAPTMGTLGLASFNDDSIQNCGAGILTNFGATDISDSHIRQITNVALQTAAGSNSTIACLGCTLTGNGTAVMSSAGSIIRLSNNDIFNNGTGINTNGGTVSSARNNRKAGNATAGAPNATIAVQ